MNPSELPPDPLDATPPPAAVVPSSPAPALPALPSFVPLTMTSGSPPGELHALSVPPGVTITHEPPPPSLKMQLAASLADVAAVAGLVAIVLTHNMSPSTGAGWIVAVLAARVKPVRLGAQAVSGVVTLLFSAAQMKPSPPPAAIDK